MDSPREYDTRTTPADAKVVAAILAAGALTLLLAWAVVGFVLALKPLPWHG